MGSLSRIASRDERGLTLVELIVTVFLLGVVSAISLSAFQSGSQTLGRVDDDVRGQGDLRNTTEQLSRDLRAARGVMGPRGTVAVPIPGSGASRVVIWIDENADYKQQSTEIVTWRLSSTADSEGHYSVIRETDSGETRTVGRALVSNLAFTYDAASPHTVSKVVTVGMEYDAIVGAYLNKKTTTYSIRMRNVA